MRRRRGIEASRSRFLPATHSHTTRFGHPSGRSVGASGHSRLMSTELRCRKQVNALVAAPKLQKRKKPSVYTAVWLRLVGSPKTSSVEGSNSVKKTPSAMPATTNEGHRIQIARFI